MKKIKEIFWKYFVEKKWGQMWGLKDPKEDDKVGIKLFGVMNFLGFALTIVMAGIFIYFLFLGQFLNENSILWPTLIGLFLFGAATWNLLGVFYYKHLRLRWSAVLHIIGVIVLLFFAYSFFIRGLK